MKYLTSYGSLWKITESQYKKLRRDNKKGKPWNLDDYGRQIGEVENVTDGFEDEL